MTYRLRMIDKPYSPTLERFLTHKSAKRGLRWWGRLTKLKLEVRPVAHAPQGMDK